MANKIIKMEEEEQFADDYNEVPPPDMVAYNELRSCADLFRMHEDGNLTIQPEFQRDLVWRTSDQTRFIDSLIKQLPIPSMCFAYDFKKNSWLVIDGLQRISTIVRFLKGEDWTLSALDDIDPNLSGENAATIKTSKTNLHQYYTRVMNQSLPVNVLRCDFSKKKHMEYLFTIFHRLNSGGVKLNNQEIRNCIYGGSLNNLLKELDQVKDWRTINNMKDKENYRFTKQEVILRFFAFYDCPDNYRGQISKFLNDYMFSNRNPDLTLIDEKRKLFLRVVGLIRSKIVGRTSFGRLPVTILESVMVGISHNLDQLENQTAAHIRALFEKFREDESVSEESLAEGLSKKDKVEARLNAARLIFSE